MQAELYYNPESQELRLQQAEGNRPEGFELVTTAIIYPGAMVTDQYFSDGRTIWNIIPYMDPSGGVACGQCRCDNEECWGECAWDLYNGEEYDDLEGEYQGPAHHTQFVELPHGSRLVGHLSWNRHNGPVAVPYLEGWEYSRVLGTRYAIIEYHNQSGLTYAEDQFYIVDGELKTVAYPGVSMPNVSCACRERWVMNGYYTCNHDDNHINLVRFADSGVETLRTLKPELDSDVTFIKDVRRDSDDTDRLIVVTTSGQGYAVIGNPCVSIPLDLPGRITAIHLHDSTDHMKFIVLDGDTHYNYVVRGIDLDKPVCDERGVGLVSSSDYQHVCYPTAPLIKSAASN